MVAAYELAAVLIAGPLPMHFPPCGDLAVPVANLVLLNNNQGLSNKETRSIDVSVVVVMNCLL